MEQPDPKEIAQMLRKPDGEFGAQVAKKMNESNVHIIQWTIDNLSLQDHDHVLEIGFGNGFHIKNLIESRKGVRYSGLDFSETMVEIAANKYEDEIQAGDISFLLGSSEAMPFPPDTFNKIFTVNTLYFWDDPKVHLRQIYQVLKPDGLFCLAIKSRTFMQHLPFTPHGFTLYEKEEVAQLLTENGFHLKNVAYKKEAAQEIGGKLLFPDAIIIVAVKK